MVASGRLTSMILWGPPGCGKTTIARLLAHRTDLEFVPLSAVFSGVADLRKVFERRPAIAGDRPRHAAVHRRDPPLQPRPAGRLPALRRGRHGRSGRRHHREPVLRAEPAAAFAVPRAGAEPARRRRAFGEFCCAPSGPSAGRFRSMRRLALRCAPSPTATAAICSTWSRYLPIYPPSRCWTPPAWRNLCNGACRSTTRDRRATTT